MGAVELDAIRKAYGDTEVIHSIDLIVAEGEFLALVGPSGCGKSTLLRMIAGLEPITGGEIRFDAQRVNELSPKQRNVAMVFQNYALYPHMSVRENVSLNLRIARVPKAEIARRVAAAASLLEIDSILDRKPAQLSGGQRQRVAMGRAIVRDPRVFLFDEPLSNLDAKLRVQMRSEIKALHRKVKTTVVYVTHDQIEALTLADRIAVMNAGRIEQIGSPMDLYRSPANHFVAGFIGSPAMNFLAATVRGNMAVLEGGAGTVTLPDALVLEEGVAVTIGLRPEHLRASASHDAIVGTVAQLEPTGSQTHATLNCGSTCIQVVFEGMVPMSIDDTVSLGVEPAHVHVFSPDDGYAITTGESSDEQP